MLLYIFGKRIIFSEILDFRLQYCFGFHVVNVPYMFWCMPNICAAYLFPAT